MIFSLFEIVLMPDHKSIALVHLDNGETTTALFGICWINKITYNVVMADLFFYNWFYSLFKRSN